jgi:hypothetical protein
MADAIKRNWVAAMSLLDLSQEQVNALTLRIVELVESYGGLMAGGFIPDRAEGADDVQEEQH